MVISSMVLMTMMMMMMTAYLARPVDAQQAEALAVGDAQRQAPHRRLAAGVYLEGKLRRVVGKITM
jgi:hypothetical protein